MRQGGGMENHILESEILGSANQHCACSQIRPLKRYLIFHIVNSYFTCIGNLVVKDGKSVVI